MKAKSGDKKGSDINNFRFVKFADRIAKINVNVVHRVGEQKEVPEDADTFFYEALVKWEDLNCTQHYENFKKDCGRDIVTLNQLVHHEKRVVQCLQKHLRVINSNAYQPLLELVVALARDLQADFYAHFPQFFKVLVEILQTRDPDLIEHTFTCLSYLFKFLWRYMVKDIAAVYGLYSPLLTAKRPVHITNFACESISFLLRKVHDKSGLLDLVFQSLEKNPEYAFGIGRLLFEVNRGVKGHFHSSIEQVLPCIFSKLGYGLSKGGNLITLPWQLVLSSQLQMMKSFAEYTTKEFSTPVWTILIKSLESLMTELDSLVHSDDVSSTLVSQHLERLISLFHLFVTHKRGSLIVAHDQIDKMTIAILKTGGLSDECSMFIVSVVAALLANHHTRDITTTGRLVSLVYRSNYSREVIWEFTKKVLPLKLFPKDVLPTCLAYCMELLQSTDTLTKETVLSLILEIIQHLSPSPITGEDLDPTSKPTLDFNVSAKWSAKKGAITFPQVLESILRGLNDKTVHEESHIIWAAVTCIPHLKLAPSSPLIGYVKQLVEIIIGILLKSTCYDKLVVILCQCVETIVYCVEFGEILPVFPPSSIKELIRLYGGNVHVLRLVDLYLTAAGNCEESTSFLTEGYFQSIFPYLFANISSPYHQVKLLTFRICNAFPFETPQSDEDKNLDGRHLFEICLLAEKVDFSYQQYRERLQFLQKLDFDLVQNCIPSGPYATVPLKYLIGTLYVNFQLFWDPCVKLISSHAVGMRLEEFWEVYYEHLNKSVNFKENRWNVEEICPNNPLHSCFYNFKVRVANVTENPDYQNVRYLLWKAMTNFPQVVEAKSRELSVMLLDLIRDGKSRIEYDVEMELDAIEENYELEEENEALDSVGDARSNGMIGVSNKIFGIHLELFAKFKNPKCFYHERQLSALYTRLLSHKNQNIQKLGVDCIMTYNHEFLTPYKQNIYRVINDNTFRSEIILFSVDSENGVVLPEHRSGLLPILLRILYAKMNSKPSVKTKGKGKTFSRQTTILNFLSGCGGNELKFFLDLSFQCFDKYITEDIDVMANNILNSHRLAHSIGHLTRSLKLLETVFKRLSNKVEHLLPWLLKLLVYHTLRVITALERRYKIKRSSAKSLKTLQKSCMEIITQFFVSFENYPYTTAEVDAIFTAFVWPKIARLSCEASSWLKLMLKLFTVWSENPRYFVLLGKHMAGNLSMSPLQKLLDLYTAKRTPMNITPTIMEIMERLLTLEDYVPGGAEEKAGTVIEVGDCVVAAESFFTECIVPPNFGTKLLFPHISSIIKRMRMTIKNLTKKQNGVVPKNVLQILARLGELMTDPKQNQDMIAILLPLVKKTEQSDQEAVLETIEHFMKNVEAPEEFLKTVTNLYAFLENHGARICLDRIMKIISRGCKKYKNVATVCEKLNAWNVKRAGEPDFIARLDGFSAANKLLEEIDILEPELLLMIIQNCFYTINIVDDLALKASASDFLVKLAEKLGKVQKTQESAVASICNVLNEEILKRIKNENDDHRQEYLGLLSALVRNCDSLSPFNELKILTDPDAELDFFENIRHIQVNMQSRALLKIAEGKFCETLSTDILMNYLIPLSKHYLFNDNFRKHNNLVDAAIGVLGKVCLHLNWGEYSAILKLYLERMANETRYHKTVVKIIVAILDVFHFDFSNARGLGKNVNFEKREENPAQDENTDEPTRVMFITLSEDEATEIYNTVSKVIFPKMQNCLMQKAKGDGRHKLSGRKYYAEDDEILRVPMAIAMVKLLQVLPTGLLDQYIPGIFLKLCEFLRSKAITIRETARETMIAIMQTLGKRYLIYLIEEMHSSMTRGYQFHVLTYTIHRIFVSLREMLQGGDLDPCITILTEICHKEIFGEVAVEKKIGKITEKTQEAQRTFGFSIYRFMGRFVSSSALTDLILPLKQKLGSSQNFRIIKKVRTCLECVIEGLAKNEEMSSQALFIFSHAIMTESIPEFTKEENYTKPAQPAKLDPRLQPKDTYLIPEEPIRGGKPADTTIKTNAHILVEFGLQLLLSELKRCKKSKADQATLEMLDPFLAHMIDCFESKHIKCVTVALQNLALLLRRTLPSVKNNLERLSNGLFALLKKYGSPGIVQSVNSYLVVNIFQVLTVMVGRISEYFIDVDKLQIILVFMDQYIADQTKYIVAFQLLSAILSRKFDVPEIHPLMSNVAKLVVTADLLYIRKNCRKVFRQYLLDYPIRDKLKSYVQFFISQLEFLEISGRESAIRMLTSMFEVLPDTFLNTNFFVIFIPMTTSLINDSDPTCKKWIASAIKFLFEKVSVANTKTLFEILATWLKDLNNNHKRLGSQLCGLYVEARPDKFIIHMEILPLLIELLEPSTYEKYTEETSKKMSDHLIFQTASSISKIITTCQLVRNSTWQRSLNTLWVYAQKLLSHPHTWVQLTAAQLFGTYFAAYPVEEVVELHMKGYESEYLILNLPGKVDGLCRDFCKQMDSIEMVPDLSDQIAKNLVYMAKLVLCMEKGETGAKLHQHKININILIKLVTREARQERKANPKISSKRTCAFKWVAALAILMGKDKLNEKLDLILPILHRELSDKSATEDSPLRVLAREVVDVISNEVGLEQFSKAYATQDIKSVNKKGRIHKRKAVTAINNPVAKARRKMSKNLSRTIAKKRKMHQAEAGRKIKRMKLIK